MRPSSARRTSAAEARQLALLAAESALQKRAQEVVLLDLRALSSVCDYFVLCHGDSEVQVGAIVEAVEEGLEQHGARAWHVEGRDARQWVLLDYVDIVVHVFLGEARAFYRLEDLWADAGRELISDVPGDAEGSHA